MDPVGGDILVAVSAIRKKKGQKLPGNHQNVDELHQTASHFLSKMALILTQEGKEYLYSDVE